LLADDVLLSATQLRLIAEQSERHSQLLYKQQNSSLTVLELNELKTLNHVYELGVVYQSQAYAEAVKRGLIQGLNNDENTDS